MTTRNGQSGEQSGQPSGWQLDAFADSAMSVARTETTQAPKKARTKKAGGDQEQVTCALVLPVSRHTVNCSFRLLDPAVCVASPLNRRIQSLLTPSNSDVVSLMTSIREEGQREPVLARPVQVNGKIRYEIIYGTRRRFAVEQLARELSGGMQLKAWVSDEIPDADARRLALSENENRTAISAWETAQYLKSQMLQNPDWTHEALAAAEGMTRSLVTRYLQLADVEERFVGLLRSPAGMTLTGGLAIRTLAAACSTERVTLALAAIREQVPFADAGMLLKALQGELVQKKRQRDVRVPIRLGNGLVRGQMVRHRTKAGCYKIDLAGLSEQQADRIRQAIETALS